ncbi:hypothetical protein BKA65DRAFT_601661 [Rhexocercosporidium sp. MPI-PUGE-AT-0058]|nr:hypothetical protein BKA65DRAFT_601661 [Rhexocercosporidium sp. MPI-PUGE-AT-0058]
MRKEGSTDHMISLSTGPEVVTGSTRMKAGTGTKMVLNMLSTGIMIKVGKTYGNMMIDVKSSNLKLQQRSKNIVRAICGEKSPASDEELKSLLAACGGSVKLVVTTILLDTSILEAKKRLEDAGGVLAEVLQDLKPRITKSLETEDYVLCVDGGGSKCCAVILGKNGESGEGKAGECNVSNVGLDGAISSISLAVQRAVDSCSATKGIPFRSIPFRKVWIGLAGYDRPNIAKRIYPLLAKMFHPVVRDRLEISNDIDFLAKSSSNSKSADSVVVLVAGTGSIAMAFERNHGQLERTGRSGGWGHLLGDDGSAYGIGRQALRSALGFADEINLRKRSGNLEGNLNPLVLRIFEHFGLNQALESPVRLLNQIVSFDSLGEISSHTKRIAAVAKVVVGCSSSSQQAREILEEGSKSLVRLLCSLVINQGIDTSKTSLVLAGGLLQSKVYRDMFLDDLDATGSLKFEGIQAINHPALNAARSLLSET